MENKNIKEITIKIEGEEWKDAIEQAYKKASKKVKIDGFRPGHAPREVFMKKYGQDALWMDAADIVIQPAYVKVFEENKDLELVAQPDIALQSVSGDAIEFKFVLTLKPEVKLGQYKKLDVTKEKVEVTKEEIDHTIEHMRNRFAENIVKEGTIEDGDIAIIDFEGFLDGVPFEGGKGENYSLKIGSHTFIPGFEEQLIGMKKDEARDIEVTFPEDYHSEDLKGKNVIFKVTINEIKTVKIPEIDADFFADLGMEGIDTLEALEKQVEENIKTRKEVDVENKYIDDLLDAAAKNVEVDIPDVMIKEELDRMIRQYEENLKMQGITLEQFYQFTNSNEEALKEQMKEEAQKRITYRLMLEEIATSEKIEITEEEAEKEADSLSEKYQMEKEEFLKQFGGIDMIQYDLKMRRALDILKGE